MLFLSLLLPLLVLSQDPLPGVPGLPGADYPVLSATEKTSFDCNDGFIPGYYAHTEVSRYIQGTSVVEASTKTRKGGVQ